MYIVFFIPCFGLNSVFRLKSFQFRASPVRWSQSGHRRVATRAELGVLLAHRMSVSLPHGLIVKNFCCVGIIGRLSTFFVCADVVH
jgi:hypothetical protein